MLPPPPAAGEVTMQLEGMKRKVNSTLANLEAMTAWLNATAAKVQAEEAKRKAAGKGADGAGGEAEVGLEVRASIVGM